MSSVQNTGHRLTYRPDSLPVQANPVFHELIVPLGGEYQLQLCDGTVVYLNAMSKLRFPNFFSGKVLSLIHISIERGIDYPFARNFTFSLQTTF